MKLKIKNMKKRQNQNKKIYLKSKILIRKIKNKTLKKQQLKKQINQKKNIK